MYLCKLVENEKRKRKLTFKKANLVTWGEEDIDPDEEEEKDEEALLYPMAFNDDIDKVESNLSCSSNDDDEVDDLYHELYDALVRVKKELKTKHAEIDLLNEKIKSLEKENHDLNLLVEQLLS